MRKFLEIGSPVAIHTAILKKNLNVKIQNPDDLPGDRISADSLGRIHSDRIVGGRLFHTVWILDEQAMTTIRVEVPTEMMGLLFQPRQHRLFPHFA